MNPIEPLKAKASVHIIICAQCLQITFARIPDSEILAILKSLADTYGFWLRLETVPHSMSIELTHLYDSKQVARYLAKQYELLSMTCLIEFAPSYKSKKGVDCPQHGVGG
jgi:hypothetical protein